jgi:hypothetical protein
LGHIRQFLSEVLVCSWCCGSPPGFVPFIRQCPDLLFELGMVALQGQELLRLMVCDLPLQIDNFLLVVTHHLYFPHWL